MLLMWKQGLDGVLTLTFPTQDPPPQHPGQGTGGVTACHTWPSGEKYGGKPSRETLRMLLVTLSLLATKFIRDLGHINICYSHLCSYSFSSPSLFTHFCVLKPQARISWENIVPKLQKQSKIDILSNCLISCDASICPIFPFFKQREKPLSSNTYSRADV